MKTTTGLLISLATTFLLGATSAGAAPYTAYMEGTTALYWDWYAMQPVPANDGQPFSIRATFDIANGTLYMSDTASVAGSERGCREVVNGVCSLDSGGALPVVTDWSIVTAFAPPGGIRPFPISDYYYDGSVRINMRLGGDVLVINRIQERCTVDGDLEVAYTRTCVSTYFNIYVAATTNTMFATQADLMDLNRTPNFADVPPGSVVFVLFTMNPTDECAKDADGQMACVTTYGPGSANWLGEFSSLVIMRDGPTSKDQCKGGGWKAFGFKNQGQCIKYVNHL